MQTIVPRQLVHEMTEEQRDLVSALPQRRHMNRESAQPVVEVLTQFLFCQRLFNVDVSSSHNAHIDINRPLAAQPEELFVLEHMQELGLQSGWHLRDLIQKNRAFLTQFELAWLGSQGAGKRTPFVSEKFALQQVAGECSTIHFEEPGCGADRQP